MATKESAAEPVTVDLNENSSEFWNWKEKFETIVKMRKTLSSFEDSNSVAMETIPMDSKPESPYSPLDNVDTWITTKKGQKGEIEVMEPSKKELILMEELQWLRNRIQTIEKIITTKTEEQEAMSMNQSESNSFFLEKKNQFPQQLDQKQHHLDSAKNLVNNTLDHDRAIKRILIQRHMKLLLHAHGCRWTEQQSQSTECPVPFCRLVKNLLVHMKTCRVGGICAVPHCYASRQIISFWKLCQISIQQETVAMAAADEKIEKILPDKIKVENEASSPMVMSEENFQPAESPVPPPAPVGTMVTDESSRLWCVCRKPENNRFMICCDRCNTWFHGSCVRVTRAQARRMEQRGDDWFCPICTGHHSSLGDHRRKKREKKHHATGSMKNKWWLRGSPSGPSL